MKRLLVSCLIAQLILIDAGTAVVAVGDESATTEVLSHARIEAYSWTQKTRDSIGYFKSISGQPLRDVLHLQPATETQHSRIYRPNESGASFFEKVVVNREKALVSTPPVRSIEEREWIRAPLLYGQNIPQASVRHETESSSLVSRIDSQCMSIFCEIAERWARDTFALWESRSIGNDTLDIVGRLPDTQSLQGEVYETRTDMSVNERAQDMADVLTTYGYAAQGSSLVWEDTPRQSRVMSTPVTDSEGRPVAYLGCISAAYQEAAFLVAVSPAGVLVTDGAICVLWDTTSGSSAYLYGVERGDCDWLQCVLECLPVQLSTMIDIWFTCGPLLPFCVTLAGCEPFLFCIASHAALAFGLCSLECGIDVCSYCDCSSGSAFLGGTLYHEDGMTTWPGVCIDVMSCGGGTLYATTETNMNGSYMVELPPGSRDVYFDRHCGDLYYLDCYTFSSSTTYDLTFSMADCQAALSGTVRHVSGAGWPGVAVFAVSCDGSEFFDMDTTDAEGDFELDLPPSEDGADRAVYFSTGCVGEFYATSCFAIPGPGNWTFDGPIYLPECQTTVTMSGYMYGPDGETPWHGADVIVTDCGGNTLSYDVTDDSGRFDVLFEADEAVLFFDPHLSDGCFFVVADEADDECIEWAPGDYSIQLALPVVIFHGTFVEEPECEAGNAGLNVVLFTCEDDFVASDMTDAAGQFEINFCPGDRQCFVLCDDEVLAQIVGPEEEECIEFFPAIWGLTGEPCLVDCDGSPIQSETWSSVKAMYR